ncbi:hydroperoxide reductase [Anaeramoeba ignava]|uniref:Hydroperoxide reductase n=1 Tax=Anaeramoeba ignava TaxID=1746090 RepID=A0A9Q0LCM6_ANAIG|nr:hydroperoxide reductase [Anaeramoeba ignava]
MLSINHVNLGNIEDSIQEMKQRPENAIKQINLDFEWLMKGKSQFGAIFHYDKGEEKIKVDNPKLMGGQGNGPSPLSLCIFAFAGLFASTFARTCSRMNIKLNKLISRCEIDFDFSRVTGLNMEKPPATQFKISLSAFSFESNEKLKEAFEVSRKRCPSVQIGENSIPVTVNTTIKHYNKVAQKKGKKINNINLDSVYTFQSELRAKPNTSIKPTIVEGAWDCENVTSPQFSSTYIEGQKSVNLWKLDSQKFLGGDSSAPSPIQYYLGGISCCLLTHYAYASSLRALSLKSLSIESQLDQDLSAEFLMSDNPAIPKMSFHFDVGTDQSLELAKELSEDCVRRCPMMYILLNKFPVQTELFINQDLPPLEYIDTEKKCNLM